MEPPSHRSNLSFCAHTENPELVLFGGEFHNGSKTVMFNDLLVYNIKRKDWMQVKSPAGPAPRSSHQVCTIKKDLGADAFVGLLMWRTHAH